MSTYAAIDPFHVDGSELGSWLADDEWADIVIKEWSACPERHQTGLRSGVKLPPSAAAEQWPQKLVN